jgi:hypothetical protein
VKVSCQLHIPQLLYPCGKNPPAPTELENEYPPFENLETKMCITLPCVHYMPVQTKTNCSGQFGMSFGVCCILYFTCLNEDEPKLNWQHWKPNIELISIILGRQGPQELFGKPPIPCTYQGMIGVEMKIKTWHCLHRWVEIEIYGSEYIERDFIIMLTERGDSIVCEIINKRVLLRMQVLEYLGKLSNQNLTLSARCPFNIHRAWSIYNLMGISECCYCVRTVGGRGCLVLAPSSVWKCEG